MSLYLYCLREPSRCGRDKAGTAPEISGTYPAVGGIKSHGVKGVNGKDGVTIRAFDGIEAIVSEVNLDDFGEMQKKAQEDIHWIKEKALAHEMVVEEAMGLSRSERDKMINNLSSVIPVKFGVIFNNEERLAKVISEQSAAIKSAFDRIRAKQEWSVKLFLKDNQKIKDQVREQSEQLSEKSKTLAALPAGMAYFMEEEFNEELERECSRRLDEEAMKTFEELKPFAAEAALVKILDSKLTGRSERMVLNSAYLVANNHLPEFEKAVAIMREKLAGSGFLLEQGGPWPPYHFTEFTND